MIKARTLPIVNTLALAWLGASAFVHFMGAGVWGFGQTFPQINRWTHGTQITASHGHFAFWGAYGMLAIALMYIILPEISGHNTEQGSKLGFTAFVSLNFSMIFLVMGFLIAGIVQVYFQRVMGMDFLEAQNYLRLWFEVRPGHLDASSSSARCWFCGTFSGLPASLPAGGTRARART